MTPSSATIRRIFCLLSITVLAFSVSCSGKKTKEDEAPTPTAPSADEGNAMGDSDSGKALGLQSITFPYDSFTLTKEAKSSLKSNAEILKNKPSVKIQVEGHCDERGGIQYNIALGEKRANSAKKYLIDLGTNEGRISTISYGKERPLDSGHTEEAWAKNRRDNFVITTR